MKLAQSKPWFVVAVCATALSFFQFVDMVKHILQAPSWGGTSVQMATIVGFAAIAVCACLMWTKH